ncbi:Hypothetical protein MVR_LOCUS250 [uncultured virus]|nr:Hypothetical protein MVR_LOCUS250 [uncultured virus]
MITVKFIVIISVIANTSQPTHLIVGHFMSTGTIIVIVVVVLAILYLLTQVKLYNIDALPQDIRLDIMQHHKNRKVFKANHIVSN